MRLPGYRQRPGRPRVVQWAAFGGGPRRFAARKASRLRRSAGALRRKGRQRSFDSDLDHDRRVAGIACAVRSKRCICDDTARAQVVHHSTQREIQAGDATQHASQQYGASAIDANAARTTSSKGHRSKAVSVWLSRTKGRLSGLAKGRFKVDTPINTPLPSGVGTAQFTR